MAEERIEFEVGGFQSAKKEIEELIQFADNISEKKKAELRSGIAEAAALNIKTGNFNRTPGAQGVDQSVLAQRLSGGLRGVAGFAGAGTIGSSIANGGAFSGNGLSGQLAGNAIAGGAGIVAAFNPIAGVIAGALGGVLSKFTDRFFGRLSKIEDQAGGATQGRVGEFAARNIAVGDDEIRVLLERNRRVARRQVDAMEQVSRVQDETSGTIEGLIGTTVRRAYDSIIG